MAKGIAVTCIHCGQGTLVDPSFYMSPVHCAECGRMFVAGEKAPPKPAVAPKVPRHESFPEEHPREEKFDVEKTPDATGTWWCLQCRIQVGGHLDFCPVCGTRADSADGYVSEADPFGHQERMLNRLMEEPARQRRRLILKGLLIFWGLMLLQAAGLMATVSPAWGFFLFVAASGCFYVTWNVFQTSDDLWSAVLPSGVICLLVFALAAAILIPGGGAIGGTILIVSLVGFVVAALIRISMM